MNLKTKIKALLPSRKGKKYSKKDIDENIDRLQSEMDINDKHPEYFEGHPDGLRYAVSIDKLIETGWIKEEFKGQDNYTIMPVRYDKTTGEEAPYEVSGTFPGSVAIANLGMNKIQIGRFTFYTLHDRSSDKLSLMSRFGVAASLDSANKKLYKRAKEIADYVSEICDIPVIERELDW